MIEKILGFLSNPVVVLILVEVLALIIAKIDPTNTIANILKKISEKLET